MRFSPPFGRYYRGMFMTSLKERFDGGLNESCTSLAVESGVTEINKAKSYSGSHNSRVQEGNLATSIFSILERQVMFQYQKNSRGEISFPGS